MSMRRPHRGAAGIPSSWASDIELASEIATLVAEDEDLLTALTAKLALAGGTMSGELNLADNLMTRALLKDYGEEVVAHGAMGSTETFDLSAGNVHTGTLDENVTITLSNPTASGDACSFLAILTHDGSGGSTVTFTNGTWVTADGADPTLSTTASATLLITGTTTDGGTTWLLSYGGCTA